MPPKEDLFAKLAQATGSAVAEKKAAEGAAAEAERKSAAGYVLSVPRPTEPDDVKALGVTEQFLEEMTLKMLLQFGAMDEHTLAWRMKVSKKIVQQICANLAKRKLIGPSPVDPRLYDLGAEGKQQAEEANRITRYLGPVPVPDHEYVRVMREQLKKPLDFDQKDIDDAYKHLVMYDPEFKKVIGPAVKSQRSILLYGAPGNGKTILGKSLTSLMKADLVIPQAVYCYGQVIKLFDPAIHKPVETDDFKPFDIAQEVKDADRPDRRWIVIKVPYVEVATEFSLRGFELAWNGYARYYEMATHVKANGGVFFIDDFGRQPGNPEDYMNRLITPLQMKEDIMKMPETGGQLRVPFFCIPFFSTNLTLEAIGDEAFKRRFKYKICAKSPDKAAAKMLWEYECRRNGVAFEPEIFDWLMARFDEKKTPIRGSFANDLISKIVDYCDFHRQKPEITKDFLEMSWELNYATESKETWQFGVTKR